MISLNPLQELASYIKSNYPEASPEEISEIAFAILSQEILPEVFKSIKLPDFPTYRMVAKNKADTLKGITTENPVDLNNRRRIIQQIEDVRYEMGWDGIDDLTSRNFHVTNSTNLNNFTENISAKARDSQKRTEVETEPDKKRDNKRSEGNSIKLEEPSKDYISLSDTAQNKVVSELIFEELLRKIEIELRKTVISRNLKAEIELICKTDAEISSWNKCILKIRPLDNLKFEERMNISTIIDLLVRKIITEMKKTADQDTSNYLRDITRNFFVHIDL